SRKDRLLFALSHDLRSPLSSILGFSEVLLEDAGKLPGEDALQFLTYIRDAARNQLKLINDLLQKPAHESTAVDLAIEEADLSEIGATSSELLSTVAKQKEIALNVQIPVGTKAHVDGQLALQVFNNLISNALKFTPPGGSISVEFVEETDRDWLIAVRDTGVGIPTAEITRLFAAGGSYSRPGLAGEKGSGFGLPLCEQIMKEIGGNISVESTTGKGTAFFLRFPKAEPEQNLSVLVVDDEAGIRALHARYIQRLLPNAHVLQAADGRKALELMVRHRPQIVFSDFAMPNMNGLALLEAAKKHEGLQHIPVVIATGHDSWAVREELETAGAYDIIAKPVPVAKFESILRTAVPSFAEVAGATP
ncbi:MAG: hybrid sensor histidine kinase/response regulator, partial [Bacteroidota bacterium]